MNQQEMHKLALGLKPKVKEDPMRIEVLRECLRDAVEEIESLKTEIRTLKRRFTKLNNKLLKGDE